MIIACWALLIDWKYFYITQLFTTTSASSWHKNTEYAEGLGGVSRDL